MYAKSLITGTTHTIYVFDNVDRNDISRARMYIRHKDLATALSLCQNSLHNWVTRYDLPVEHIDGKRYYRLVSIDGWKVAVPTNKVIHIDFNASKEVVYINVVYR